MYLAPAEQGEQLIAGLLEGEASLHQVGMRPRHVDRPFESEKIRSVQHVHVERMAFDPFAAVEQPPQIAQRLGHGYAERVFHRLDCAHLIGHRTNAADAGGDVRRVGVGAPAQQRLEKPRRLVDAELGLLHRAVADDDMERALAFDARKRIDLYRPTSHDGQPRCGTARPRR